MSWCARCGMAIALVGFSPALASAEPVTARVWAGVPGLSWYAGTGAVSPALYARGEVESRGVRLAVGALAAPIHLLEPVGSAFQLSGEFGAARAGPAAGWLGWRTLTNTGRITPTGPEGVAAWGQAIALGYRSDDDAERSISLFYLVSPANLGQGTGEDWTRWATGQGARAVVHTRVPQRDRMWAGMETGFVVGEIRWWTLLVGWRGVTTRPSPSDQG